MNIGGSGRGAISLLDGTLGGRQSRLGGTRFCSSPSQRGPLPAKWRAFHVDWRRPARRVRRGRMTRRSVRRDDKDPFRTDQVDVGKSSAADQRQHSKKVAMPSHGDKGDRPSRR